MIRRVCAILSYLALACVLAAPLLYFFDRMDKPAMKLVLSAATLVWFVCGGIVRAHTLPTR